MIKVLLIDDHPIVRAGIRLLLEQSGDILVVGETGRGSDALRLAESLLPDVVLLDMEMPDKSGVEVAEELDQAQLNVRVLALSAYDDDQYIATLFLKGAVGYVTKEEAPELIVRAVREVAQGHEKWLSKRMAERVGPLVRNQALNQETTAQPPVRLTAQEKRVVHLLSQGYSNSRIAATLEISEQRVRTQLSNIYDKLNVASRSEVAGWADANLPESTC